MEWPRMAVAMGLLTHLLAFVEGLLHHHVGVAALSWPVAYGVPSLLCALVTAGVLGGAARQPALRGPALLPGALLLGVYPLQVLFWSLTSP